MTKTTRPQRLAAQEHCFDTIVGHSVIKQYLKAACANDILHHALLFAGPSDLGKTSMAYGLAKHLNCRRGGPADCDCGTCRRLSEGLHPDLLTIEPRGAAGLITLSGWRPGKDDPDNLQYYRFVESRPLEDGKKVLIIRQAERMNVAVANYLLKLIEEPPSYLLIILITHRPADILNTIRSRCAPLRFSPLSTDEMLQFAADGSEKTTDAEYLLRISEGRPGRYLQLQTEAAAGEREELARVMQTFQQHGFLALFGAASDLLNVGGKPEKGADPLERALTLLESWIRDTMIAKCASPEAARRLLIHTGVQPQLESYAAQSEMQGLAKVADSIREFSRYAGRPIDRNYILETLLLRIGRAMRRPG